MCIRWYVSYVFLVWIYWINPVLPPYGSSMPRWPTRPLSTRWRLWRHGVNLQGGEEGCSLDTRQICSPWEVLWWVVRLKLHCCISQAVRAVGYATLDVAAQCRAAAKSGDPSVFGSPTQGRLFLKETTRFEHWNDGIEPCFNDVSWIWWGAILMQSPARSMLWLSVARSCGGSGQLECNILTEKQKFQTRGSWLCSSSNFSLFFEFNPQLWVFPSSLFIFHALERHLRRSKTYHCCHPMSSLHFFQKQPVTFEAMSLGLEALNSALSCAEAGMRGLLQNFRYTP